MAASESLCAHLRETVVPGDTVEVVNALTGDDVAAIDAGERALATFDEGVTVRVPGR